MTPRTSTELLIALRDAYLPGDVATFTLEPGDHKAIATLMAREVWGEEVAGWLRSNGAVKHSLDQYRAEQRAKREREVER